MLAVFHIKLRKKTPVRFPPQRALIPLVTQIQKIIDVNVYFIIIKDYYIIIFIIIIIKDYFRIGYLFMLNSRWILFRFTSSMIECQFSPTCQPTASYGTDSSTRLSSQMPATD